MQELVQRGRAFLERKGLESPRLEAELLVAHALGLERLQLFLALDRPVDERETAAAREALVRRGNGEPCAYVTGTREFYGRPFAVGPGVLIPRPETELVVDLARERLAGRGSPRVLDVGTGSGCLAITLALECEGARVEAVELSEAALAFARRNAEARGADVTFHLGDGVEPARANAPFDLIVSNPPYIDPNATEALAADVRAFEPPEALFAPAGDPDHWVKRLTGERSLLADGGALLIELGYDQHERVAAWLRGEGVAFTLHEDLAKVPRVLELHADAAGSG